ncbi:MAG: hypothetical protein JXA90_04550, partial [Planctomycetes bacterium]|nr:hypothetical protein [Planctomycetota bacterium]
LRPIVESQGSSVVSAADQALGRWVLLGFSFQSRDPDPRASELLLARAVRYRPIEDGLRVISPRPGDVFAAGDEIPIEWAAHGERAGTVRISCSTDGSTEEYPLEVALAASDAAGGSYLWTAPAPQPGSYYTCRLQVSWTDPPPLTASSEGEFFITPAPLQIETTSLANGFTGADYSSEIRVRGGAPPYLFDTGGDLPAGLYLPSPDEGQTHSHISGVPLETCSNRPVHLQVTDAAGTTLGRTYTITVSSSRIQILSPAGGEYLLAGGAHGVQWQVFGYVGDSVAVRYNTDGNSRDFPELAGESLPVDSAFTWQVPSGLRAERCRLQIESDLGYRSITERTFTISAAGITCLSPNGNEVLETGCQRMIRWRSLGNPGGRVRIELLVGLGAMSWSQEIVADTPDTGSFFWSVPLEPSEDCRIRVHSLADPLLDDVSDGLFSIRYRNPVRGLIWIPYTGFDQLEVRGAVAAVTLHENDFDWFLSLARQPEEVGAELVGKETFVMVQQTPAEDVNFAARGRAMSDVLQRFAAQGGTVVVLKQIGRAKEFLPASGLLNAVEVGHGFDVSAEVADPDHPVMNQLPSTFRSSTATAWYSITGEDVDVYATDAEGHPIVAGRDIGDGRVVVIGFDYRDYTPESARVIANAVRMVRATGRRAHFVRGDTNADGRIDIVDAIFLLRHLYHGGAEPPCLDAADVDDSALLGQRNSPIDLTDAIHLLLWLFVGGATPPPPTPLAPVPLSPYCGTDPQYRDGLECASYPLCN